MEIKYNNEISETEEEILKAQNSYNDLLCLSSYTVEDEFIYRNALAKLDKNNIWYYVRNGLITSILIKNEDVERAQEILEINNASDA